jgi:hypothetical protein
LAASPFYCLLPLLALLWTKGSTDCDLILPVQESPSRRKCQATSALSLCWSVFQLSQSREMNQTRRQALVICSAKLQKDISVVALRGKSILGITITAAPFLRSGPI